MFLVEAVARDWQCAACGVRRAAFWADKSNDISIAGDSLPLSREDAQGWIKRGAQIAASR